MENNSRLGLASGWLWVVASTGPTENITLQYSTPLLQRASCPGMQCQKSCDCRGSRGFLGHGPWTWTMDGGRGNHRASSQTRSNPRGMGEGSVSLDIVTTSGTSFPPDKTRHALVKPKLTPYPPDATPVRALIPWPHVSTNFATTHPIASLLRTGGCCALLEQQQIQTEPQHLEPAHV